MVGVYTGHKPVIVHFLDDTVLGIWFIKSYIAEYYVGKVVSKLSPST